jgi:hypothetical protein
MRRTALALAVASLACLAATAHALTAAEVAGATKNEDGQLVIQHGGLEWQVVDDESSKRPYFYHPEKGSQWDDPRAPGELPGGWRLRPPRRAAIGGAAAPPGGAVAPLPPRPPPLAPASPGGRSRRRAAAAAASRSRLTCRPRRPAQPASLSPSSWRRRTTRSSWTRPPRAC